MVRLDILSDPVCPWCFIGKAELDRALAARPGHPFTVEWHPFQLNPELPPEGVDRDSYLRARMGGPEGMARAEAVLAERAAQAGVVINRFPGQRLPNTFDAHRLIHWAGIEGRQGAAVDALFAASFTTGRDIGNRAVLADIAGEIGLDRAAIQRLLESDADAEMIRNRESHSRARGVSAVPTFIIDDHYVVQGAQPADLWLQVIDEITSGPPGDPA